MSTNITPGFTRAATKRCSPNAAPKTAKSDVFLKIKDSATALQSFMHQWNKYHLTGAIVINSIKTLKFDSMRSYELEQFYMEGLQERCYELQNVLFKMESCMADLKVLVQQLNALVELEKFQGGNDKDIAFSWSTEKFRNAFLDILFAYSKELSLKFAIKEEIAHCKNSESLTYHLSSWTLQPFINDSCRLRSESIFCEVGLG